MGKGGAALAYVPDGYLQTEAHPCFFVDGLGLQEPSHVLLSLSLFLGGNGFVPFILFGWVDRN